ncbi:MAG: EAL domain-containing protein [Firmicutes bacterium]|nr:EAL domain-containing protein [Bacillota bacterium]
MRKFTRNIYLLGIIFAIVAGINMYAGLMNLDAPFRREEERQMEAKLAYVLGELTSVFSQGEQVLRTIGYAMGMHSEADRIGSLVEGLPQYTISVAVPGDDTFDSWYSATEDQDALAYTVHSLDPLVITGSRPVYGTQGEMVAVIAVELLLDELLSTVGETLDGEFGVLILSDDVVLVSDLDETVLEAVSFQQPRGRISLEVAGVLGDLGWERVGESALTVAAFLARGGVSGFSGQNQVAIAVVIVSLVLGTGVVFWFLRIHLVKPMRDLGYDLMAISLDRDASYRLPPGKNHSLGIFRQTLNVSLHKAQEHYEHMRRQQVELEEAYNKLKTHEQTLQEQYIQLRENKEKIRILAELDDLTSLPNRRRFQVDLQDALESGLSGAVILLDLDNFQEINDTLGHRLGDYVLCSVADLLKEELPPQAEVYRFGGDEFAIITHFPVSAEGLALNVGRITQRLQEITAQEGIPLGLTSSLGVVRYPLHGRTVEELLVKVDVALHHVKRQGKNHLAFFQENMAEVFNERVWIEGVLTEAVQNGAFSMVYQPIIATDTGSIACFEAFVRLKNHSLPPSVFIPIAEEVDLNIPIGSWVIKEVMQQIATWQAEGKKVKPVSVNLSVKQFHDPNLIELIREQLQETGIDSSLFEVEFPEEVLLNQAEKALETMNILKSLGISLSLDDYGSGYSFIDYMIQMPIDYLKVHATFTETIHNNPEVMEGLVGIANGLGMEIVAVEVDTLEQARRLSQVGCHYLQGYLLSPPLSSLQAGTLLSAENTDYLAFLAREKESHEAPLDMG